MRKKYLSALLFGALLFASTGTFTSCKDYDDDIDGLQEQITSNANAIADLQKLVGQGKWVTAISPIENGFTVTMSDGSTQTITGTKGEDGKPGTVITLDPTTNNWIIDGVDTGICAKGEKGDTGAAGEQGPAGEAGEPGKSPYIDQTTGNWFVWEWDETAGEYKAVDSEVYAGSTQIYVVEKEGFIELTVDGTAYLLPTTSDAYTVSAPYSLVKIYPKQGKWNPTTANKDYQALLKAFPEIGKIEKDSLLKQGAELPVLVTPAAVDLTEGFTFSLQSLKAGMVEDITLSNPTKGVPGDWKIVKDTYYYPIYDENGEETGDFTLVDGESYMSRAASAEDCFWTLQVNQELKDNKYATASDVAIVVENANGKVVKTPFVYTIGSARTVGNVSIIDKGSDPELASEIDLLAPAGDKENAPIVLKNEFEGKYIITLADKLQVEKYGLSIVDGHKLVIANPGNETKIPVTLNVIALGLNGSTANKNIIINVSQTIASTGQLSEKTVTLSTKAVSDDDPTIGQIVKWDIEELGFTTATALDKFIQSNAQITLEDGDEKTEDKKYDVTIVDADGEVTTDYSKADAFQFVLPSEDVLPEEYKVVLEAKESNSVIYKTETTLTVTNPKVEDLFALASAYTTDGKVLQVVGVVDGDKVTYTIADGIVEKITDIATLVAFEDLDNTNWQESDGSQAWGSENWVAADGKTLTIAKEGVEMNKEGKEHLYKERNIRGTYYLFDNEDNEIEYDFKIKVLSSVYTADGSNVKIDATKMAGNFASTIDTKKGISATYAAGISIGKPLSLFTTSTADSKKTVNVYTTNGGEEGYNISGEYVLDTAGMPIEIAKSDLMKFGMSAEDYVAVKDPVYLKVSDVTETPSYNGWSTIMTTLLMVYEDNGEGGLELIEIEDETDEAKAERIASVATGKALFDTYGSKIAWKTTEIDVPGSTTSKAKEIESVKFEFVDNDALKYGTIDEATGVITTYKDIKDSDLVDGKAVVKVKMTIKDVWGMSMTKTFDVTITKK